MTIAAMRLCTCCWRDIMLAPEALAAAERVARYSASRAMRAARVLGQEIGAPSADGAGAARDAGVPDEAPRRASTDPPADTAAGGGSR
jgi:hypothetical protein